MERTRVVLKTLCHKQIYNFNIYNNQDRINTDTLPLDHSSFSSIVKKDSFEPVLVTGICILLRSCWWKISGFTYLEYD